MNATASMFPTPTEEGRTAIEAGYRKPWVLSPLRICRGASQIAMFSLIAIILQVVSGTYKSDFSGNVDSPAHYVTSIMVAQYLRGGLSQSPVKFAKEYYLHYPKVAIGHWPPLYYLCAGLWGLVFGVGHTSFLIFMALIAGLMATLLSTIVAGDLGRWEGLAAGALLLLLPPVREGSQFMMLDTMVALLSLLAGYQLVRLFAEPRPGAALLFGLIASCAILTKGTGLALVLVPPLMVILTRNWKLLRQPVFWLPAIVVACVAGPWTIYSINMAKNGFEYELGRWAYTQEATKTFLWFLVRAVGPVLSLIAAYGIWSKVGKPSLRGGVRPVWAMLFALLLSALMFPILVPASIGLRHLMAAFPSVAAFVVAGIAAIPGLFRELRWSRGMRVGVSSVMLIAGVATMRKPQSMPTAQFNKLVEYVFGRYSAYPKIAILVCSDSVGEGAVISEFAAREPKPGRYFILRGSKQLAQGDWGGHEYHLLFHDEQSVKRYLESVPITLILLDRSVDADPNMKHVAQVESILARVQSMWRLDSAWSLGQPTSPRRLELYTIDSADYRVPAKISVDMKMILGKTLESTE
jgi:hypothetical protein